jgi:rhodanese-related sulfurtransferase
VEPGSSKPAPSRGVRRRAAWAAPIGLAVALAAYHVWDLKLRPVGTGLTLKLTSRGNTRRVLTQDPKAVVLDVRVNGAPGPFRRTVRIPGAELPQRFHELDRYRDGRVFVLAATDADAVAAAAFLARHSFRRVACLRVPEASAAQARAP